MCKCQRIITNIPNPFELDINNVGSMSQVLYSHNANHYDDAKAAGWQTAQVSTFSLTNFLGRIFIGIPHLL